MKGIGLVYHGKAANMAGRLWVGECGQEKRGVSLRRRRGTAR